MVLRGFLGGGSLGVSLGVELMFRMAWVFLHCKGFLCGGVLLG